MLSLEGRWGQGGVGTHDPTLSCQNKCRKGEKMAIKEWNQMLSHAAFHSCGVGAGLQSNGVGALTWNPPLPLLQVLKVPTCSSTTCRRSSETRTFSRCSCLSETWFLPKSSSTNRQTLASASVRTDADFTVKQRPERPGHLIKMKQAAQLQQPQLE